MDAAPKELLYRVIQDMVARNEFDINVEDENHEKTIVINNIKNKNEKNFHF